ncbi:MAG: response regulator [Gemmatimonadetes bacterium]|nr:response regulator [Gemmatimonadota bacterium]
MARILVIDDDADVRSVIRRHLQTEGHDVVEAADGRAGMKLFRDRPADLVVTDLFMPEQEGLETIRELRRSFKDAKILVVTGAAPGGSFDFRAHAARLGAGAALTKPFTREELLGAVHALLDS